MPATEAVQMIDPLPAARMIGLACLMARNGPIRLILRTSIQKSGVTSSMGVQPPLIPALAKTTSRPPKSATARSMAPFTSGLGPGVAQDGHRRPAGIGDEACGLVDGVGAIEADDPGAFLREQAGAGPADAAGRAGDDGDAALKAPHQEAAGAGATGAGRGGRVSE